MSRLLFASALVVTALATLWPSASAVNFNRIRTGTRARGAAAAATPTLITAPGRSTAIAVEVDADGDSDTERVPAQLLDALPQAAAASHVEVHAAVTSAEAIAEARAARVSAKAATTGMAALRSQLGITDGRGFPVRDATNDHSVVCHHMNALLQRSPPHAEDDNAFLTHWEAEWSAAPATVADPTNLQRVAQEVVQFVRWRFSFVPPDRVCDALLNSAVVAHQRVYEHRHIQRYTLGLEWELHFVVARPGVTRENTVWPFASSDSDTQDTELLGTAPWLLVASDHGRAGTIVELSFAPMAVDAEHNGPILHFTSATGGQWVGGDTARTLRDQRGMVANFKEAVVVASRAAGRAGGQTWDFAGMPAVAAEYDARNRGQSQSVGTAADEGQTQGVVTTRPAALLKLVHLFDPFKCYNNERLAPVRRGAQSRNQMVLTRACQMPRYHHWELGVATIDGNARAAPDTFRTNEYVQTNYLMAVSGLASTAFQAVHHDAWQCDWHDAVRHAAREWARSIPDLGHLPAEDRADLLGVLTQWLAHTVYHATCGLDSTPFPCLPPPSTSKNWFDHMIKSNTQLAVKLLSPFAGAVWESYISNRMTAPALPAQLFRWLNAAFLRVPRRTIAHAPDLSAWIRVFVVSQPSVCAHLLAYMPSLSPTAVGHPTSPSGGGGANAVLRVGGGGNSGRPGVLSVVVESRTERNRLNAAVIQNDVAAVNAYFRQVQKQFTWDGTAESWPQ